jgi:hypothetical protein
MKKFLRWAAAVILVLLAIVVGLFLFKDPILKKITVSRIRSQTGLQSEIGAFHISLGSGAVHLQNFKLLNLGEFGGSPLLDIPEIYLLLDAQHTTTDKLHFKEVRLNLAQLHVIKDKSGRYNIDQLAKLPKQPKAPKTKRDQSSVQFGGIDRLYVTLGSIKYTDLRDPTQNEEMNLNIKDELFRDVRTEEELQARLLTIILGAVIQDWLEKPRDSRRRGLANFWKLLTQ